MKNKIINSILVLVSVFSIGFTVLVPVSNTHAVDLLANCKGSACEQGGKSKFAQYMKNIINLMLYLAGIIAVIAIIVSGLTIMTASGDPGKIKTAKNALLYAVVGLIIAVAAFAIVNFVINGIS